MESEIPNTQEGGDDLVVFIVRKDAKCDECGCALHSGDMLRLEKKLALCLDCADVGQLEFLPRGDAAVTRRAGKYSALRAVVVKWSSARKRYERQGILVEPAAIDRAEAECAADAPARAEQRAKAAQIRARDDAQFVKQFAAAILARYPHCPADEAARITAHACAKYSGRVGRSAMAKDFDEKAVDLAVLAAVRHRHTNYDSLLISHGDRQLARQEVRDRIDAVLARWRGR